MSRKGLVFLVLGACLAVAPALAQTDQTGVIEGNVVDAGGGAVAGAVVVVAQADGAYPRTAVTEDDGTVRIAFLPPGEYNVRVEAAGFRTQVVEAVRVSAAKRVTVTVELEPATQVVETVSVTAEAPLIETTSTDLGTSLDSEQTELLPSTRDATNLVKFTPGATNGTLWGGSTSQSNAYQLDGVNVTDPGFGGNFLLPNVDWIEEFQVRGLGAGAEYGNFTGGLVNYVTKSGTNTFSGAVRVNYESADLASSNVNAFEAGQEQDSRFEVNASVGGPFIKNKLFYFFSVQQVREDTNVVDTLTSDPNNLNFFPLQEERTEEKALGKLTWQATDSDIFNFLFGIDNVDTDNRGLNSFDSPDTATTQESPATFWNVSWQRVFGPRSFLELKVTGYEGDDDRLPKFGDRNAVVLLDVDRNAFLNSTYTRYRTRENLAFTANWDLYLTTGSLKHHLKIGADWNEGSWLERRTRNGSYTWRPETLDGTLDSFDPIDPATWGFISSDWGGLINLDAETLNAAVWVQDYLTISPKLSVNFGLRQGLWEGELTSGFRDPLQPELGPGDTFKPIDADAIDPRVGFAWDVTGEANWVVKGHWGRYHQNLFALFFDRAEGGNVFTNAEYWDWVSPDLPDLNTRYTLDSVDGLGNPVWEFFDDDPIGEEVGPVVDYDQPYVDQYVLSVEKAFGNRWKAGLTYVNREFEKIVGLIDTNLMSNYTRYANVRLLDSIIPASEEPIILPEVYISNDDILFVGSAPGLTPAEVAALDFDQNFVLTNLPDARRSLDQVQLTVSHRGAKLTFDGSIVWSDFKGNWYSVSGYDDPGGTGAGPFVRPNQMINFYGNLEGSNELEVKGAVTGRLPWDLRFGSYVLYTSGQSYTPVYEIDRDFTAFELPTGEILDGDFVYGLHRETLFTEPRGDREYDGALTIDFHLERPFDLGKGLVLTAGFDVFNLFDEDAVTRRENDLVDSSFGEVTRRVAPRTWRLNAKLSW